MSTSADWAAYELLPGNTGMTFLVDIRAFQNFGGSSLCSVRFNRPVPGEGTMRCWVTPGHLSEEQLVVGSTKAGVDILRPHWSFIRSGAKYVLSSSGCSGRTRSLLVSRTSAAWTATNVISWQTISPAVGPEYVVSGPFRWVDLWQPGGKDLCN